MTIGTDQIPAVLETIKVVEGGSYNARPTGPGTASGAYQFTDPTWIANGGGTYADHAYLATPPQQDEIATRKVRAILASQAGASDDQQLAAIAQTWYLGHPASGAELNQVPGHGNKLTVAQYTQNWINTYRVKAGKKGGFDPIGDPLGTAAGVVGDATSAVAGAVTDALGGLLGDLVDPFITGLRRLSLIGLSVLLGVGLVGFGAYRSVSR